MTAPVIVLDPIALGNYRHGAYIIKYAIKGTVPPGARVFLAIGGDRHLLEITGRSKRDVMGADNLPQLLRLIGQLNAWGTPVDCTVQLRMGAQLLARSNAQPLACPVKPYTGPLTFDGIAREIPPLTYPGNGHGRTWVEIDGKRYFRHGSKLETDNAKRGFDCTTFPMAMFDVYPNMAGKYGTALADALYATKCDMEVKKEADVKAFFEGAGKQGLYFMWSAGHVVLVENATIHEFTYGGYKRTPAAEWEGYRKAPQGLWWIRRLHLDMATRTCIQPLVPAGMD